MKRDRHLALFGSPSPQVLVLVLGVSLALNQANWAAEAEPAQPEEPAKAAAPAAESPQPTAPAPTAENTEETEPAKEEEKTEDAAEEPVEYRNWTEVSVGGVIVDGDKGAYRRRYGLPAGAFGGVQDFHYEQDVGKKGLFKVDGRGVFDNHDYSLKFDLQHPDMGYLRGGYREFRSYYDGSGGFFHPTDSWITPFNDDLAVDRGDFFFEGGLTLPNKPSFVFRYDHLFREGKKDSTSWGDLTIPGYGVRKIVPGFWDLDETRDIFAGDVKHTVKGTTLGLGLRYELSSTDNSRNILRSPGEATSRYGTSREKVEGDLFNVHAFSETPFHDKVLFTTGYSFTTLETDLSGYRVYGTAYDPAFAQRLPFPDTFENLDGGSELKQHVANLNLRWQLTDSLVLVPSLRIAKEEIESVSEYNAAAAPFSGFPYETSSDRGLLDVTEKLELRYTGITNWVFYTRGEWLQGSGDLRQDWDNLGTGVNVVRRSTDSERFWQTYTIGANWYPLRRLNFGAQYYHKERSNDFDHDQDSTPNTIAAIPGAVYPAFLTAQHFSVDDLNLRATWRPLGKLTLVARYDLQFADIDTRPDNDSRLRERETAEMTSHIVSGTVSWTPVSRLYLQAGANVVWDRTDTPADEVSRAVLVSKNNYWTANSSLGYALDDKTDLQLQYMFYRADNLQDNSSFGLPYGAEAREHGVTAAVIRRISERIRVTLKYGFFDGQDRTAGGRNDYQAHLIYSSLHCRF